MLKLGMKCHQLDTQAGFERHPVLQGVAEEFCERFKFLSPWRRITQSNIFRSSEWYEAHTVYDGTESALTLYGQAQDSARQAFT